MKTNLPTELHRPTADAWENALGGSYMAYGPCNERKPAPTRDDRALAYLHDKNIMAAALEWSVQRHTELLANDPDNIEADVIYRLIRVLFWSTTTVQPCTISLLPLILADSPLAMHQLGVACGLIDADPKENDR